MVTRRKTKKTKGRRARVSHTDPKLPPKVQAAVKKAADALWGVGVPPKDLLRELHDVLLLRCLDEAEGNYAGAAELFGPSRQSVQQYANSPLRDGRWRNYTENKRKGN